MDMEVDDDGYGLTKDSEGLRLVAYPDPGTGGAPWTLGYGRAHGIVEGQTCTEEEASQWLKEDMAFASAAVNHLVTVPRTQGMHNALADFVYNLGQTAFGSSTLLRKLNAGDHMGASAEFPKWVHGGNNQVLPGLVNRRARERNLFDGKPWQDIP